MMKDPLQNIHIIGSSTYIYAILCGWTILCEIEFSLICCQLMLGVLFLESTFTVFVEILKNFVHCVLLLKDTILALSQNLFQDNEAIYLYKPIIWFKCIMHSFMFSRNAPLSTITAISDNNAYKSEIYSNDCIISKYIQFQILKLSYSCLTGDFDLIRMVGR